MSWPAMMAMSFVGLTASMVAVVLTVYQGIRYRKWLPKQDVAESLEALKLNLAESEEEYDGLREQLFQAKADIQRSEELREWMETTREEVAELENRRKELEDIERELNQTQSQLSDTEERLSTVRVEELEIRERLAAQRRDLIPDAELRARRQEQELLASELQSLARRCQEETARTEALEGQRKELQQAVGELEDALGRLRIQHVELREEIAGMQKRRESLIEHLKELREAGIQLTGTSGASDVEASTALLWEPAVQADQFSTPRPGMPSEVEALQVAIDRIKDAGFIYDDRVLRAFHTSLKCAEEAPLLVLAGISGTGKSALPTRYAEAMGMHFLNVPVQPGWDSPADLLGFYNHLEGRYRPTELTRALLQMDYVHRAAAADAEAQGADEWPIDAARRSDLSKRMLLVLLDEMNLARVEYYFSEFLSRLEQRRGIDPTTNRHARARAELILDLGSAGQWHRQSLSTYVGKNVLFVGTMNEDESTQTLSDKVIDRSNVMRFGRPANLGLDEREAGENPKPPVPFLPRAVWERWVADQPALGVNDRVQVDLWIARVNDLLDRIGRPFAYRVAEAMRTYVQQYPVRSEEGIREAFADQVELRVLPRLRGLDVNEQSAGRVIDEITRLVESELEDEPLSKALHAARQRSGEQLFHWYGVDRRQANPAV